MQTLKDITMLIAIALVVLIAMVLFPILLGALTIFGIATIILAVIKADNTPKKPN